VQVTKALHAVLTKELGFSTAPKASKGTKIAKGPGAGSIGSVGLSKRAQVLARAQDAVTQVGCSSAYLCIPLPTTAYPCLPLPPSL